MLGNIVLLVVNFVFSFITLVLLARFFMQWQRVPFRNQIGHFVLTTTDWIVRPLRRAIPGLFGLDLASLLPAWAFQTAHVFIEMWLRGASFDSGPGSLLLGLWGLGLVELMRMGIYLLFAIILVSAVLSWVSPHSPAAPVFRSLADPFLRPIRRVLPLVANIDLSPLVFLLFLQILLIVVGGLRGSFMPLLSGGG